ncbi:MAG: hypothetical protein KI790_21155 [Cyclobacteriaceae bacterium]|nr:hypothetical protein [Cyclobacteriaceae bacterium HetDA_MAG_MS6]
MKAWRYLFLIGLISCTSAYFETPQPVNGKDLKKFPKKMLGTYLVDDDTVVIRAKSYHYTENFQRSIPLALIDSFNHVTFEDSLLYDSELPITHAIPYSLSNDTLRYELDVDMSVSFSDSLILRRLGPYFVLNEKVDNESYWNAYLIRVFGRDSLTISHVGHFQPSNDGISKIKYDGLIEDFLAITTFKPIDDDSYLINPTRQELETLIEQGFFVDGMTFKRIDQ